MKIREIYNKLNKFIFHKSKLESKFSETLILSSNKILKSKIEEIENEKEKVTEDIKEKE
jgi:hypothetical protein